MTLKDFKNGDIISLAGKGIGKYIVSRRASN